MRKKTSLFTILFLLYLTVNASQSFADITITSNMTGKGLGMSPNAVSRIMIKGLKQRNEVTMGNKSQVTLFDLDAMTMTILNREKREAEVYSLADLTEIVTKNTQGEPRVKVEPLGQTREILGHKCKNYKITIVIPLNFGGSDIVGNTQSVIWLAENAKGSEDYIKFFKAMADKGVFLGDPRVAKAPNGAGNIKAQNEISHAITELNGLPLDQEMNMKFSGNGPLGSMMSKMDITLKWTATEISTETLSSDLFSIPEGWKVKEKRK